jgi:histidinol-phosphate aminotransferase
VLESRSFLAYNKSSTPPLTSDSPSDYKDDGTNILLDANENAYGPGLSIDNDSGKLKNALDGHASVEIDLLGLNRYPDPHQPELKQLLCTLRNTHTHTEKTLTPDNLFVGVGSDEAIDALIRAFCTPGKDKILTCPPTYGMYSVSAQVNDVTVVKAPLDVNNDFALQPYLINEMLSQDAHIKMVYICSPGNPTASLARKEDVEAVLRHPTWNGIVVLDEAYIDFASDGTSLAEWVNDWPNLVVMQTLSKAFGLAGIRLGAAFTSPPIARLLNSLKAPYNISNPTSQLAIAALQPKNLAVMRENRDKIIQQRDIMLNEMPKIQGVGRFRGGASSNFLLAVYEQLAEARGVVVRFRGKEPGCLGCLRITVGTESEVSRFLREISSVLETVRTSQQGKKLDSSEQKTEDKAEEQANDVIA